MRLDLEIALRNLRAHPLAALWMAAALTLTLALPVAAFSLLRAAVVAGEQRTALWAQLSGPTPLALLMISVLLLLVCCASVGAQLLNLSVERSREHALGASLGASPRRLVRQRLLIGGLLVLASLAPAALVARAFIAGAVSGRIYLGVAPETLGPHLAQAGLGGATLVFGAILASVTAVLIGLPAAIHVSRADIHRALKESARTHAGSPRLRLIREVLLQVQCYLAAALVVPTVMVLLIADERARSQLASAAPGLLGYLSGMSQVIWPFVAFGLIILVLLGLSLHGMASAFLMARVGEIGVRVALGASPASLIGLVLREGLPSVGRAVGFTLGMFAWSAMIGTANRHLVAASVLGSALIVLTGLAALAVPVWRIRRLSPLAAIRSE